MDNIVYKVTTVDDEIYWVDDAHSILDSFGTVLEVTKYVLTNPEDITDAINGQYYVDE
jgi:hypothetical protein